MKPVGSYLLLTFMIVMWSFSFVLVDIAIEYIPPLSLALYRFVVASIILITIDIFTKVKRKKREKVLDFTDKSDQIEETPRFLKKDYFLLLIASFTGISLFFFAQYSAIQLIGPSLPSLFVCLLAPVIISIFAVIFFKEKITKIKVVGFTIATIGAFLLTTGGDVNNLSPRSPNFFGYMFALVTPLLWATYSTITKKLTKTKSNINVLKLVSYFGTVEILILVLSFNELLIFVANLFNVVIFLCAMYLGLGCYIVGYYIWQKTQKELHSSKGASFLYIEPFITLLFSFLLQRSETIVFWNIIGGIIVLVAVLIINYK